MESESTTASDTGRLGWKCRPKRGGPWLHVDRLAELDDVIEGNPYGSGDEYEIVATWMTQAERDALGEFDGW